MSESEYKIFNNNNKLIVCFGGMGLQMGKILPFEFLNYLSSIYSDCDLLFYIDKNKCWYDKGIYDITNNIDDTVLYLNNIIKDGNYEKVIFMGASSGGYASSHRNERIKALVNKHNNVLYAVPYQHFTNSIENYFSMLKSRLQKLDGLTHEKLKENIENVISKIPREKYINIFKGAYERPEKYVEKNKTRKRKLKNYKE